MLSKVSFSCSEAFLGISSHSAFNAFHQES
jgi:hypothetical protein